MLVNGNKRFKILVDILPASTSEYDLSGGEYVFLPFEKGVNNGGDLILFYINSCLVTCHWNGLLTREIMTLTKGFYEMAACQS